MGPELHVPVALLYSFLLVLARVGGVILFVPMPAFRNAPDPIRILLILAVTIALFPVWPALPHEPSMVEYAGWILIESAFGLCIGLLIGFLSDAALLFGTLSGLHAGFSFASTVDPESQADSPVLSTIAQAVSALLFVTLGLHRYVIRIFAHSLETLPPGSFLMHPKWGAVLIEAAGTMFTVGLRLALPMIALLVMVDVTMALLTRINASLQIMHFSMPLKMLAALATFSILLTLFPTIYSEYADRMLHIAAGISR